MATIRLVFGSGAIPGFAPIPFHLGGHIAGEGRDVAGGAGHPGGVFVQTLILVGRLAVTVRTTYAVVICDTDRKGLSGDLVLYRAVAVDTEKAFLAHVDINFRVGVVQGIVQVSVFNRQAPAKSEAKRS